MHGRTEHALGVRHHRREAAIRGRHRRQAAGRAVRVERILFGGGATVVDIAQRLHHGTEIARQREVGEAFAVRDRDRRLGAGHAREEDRRRIEHFDHAEARLELFRLVARELRPGLGAGNDRFQVRQHLAAVAHAEAEGVLAREEGGELVGQLGVEEDGLGPALAGSEHVAVGEAAHRDHAVEVGELRAAGDQVAHVDVDRGKAGPVHRPSGLDVRIDALLTQDRHAWTHASRDEGRGDVFARIEAQRRRDARAGFVEQAVVFLVSAVRIVAQARNVLKQEHLIRCTGCL